MITRLCATNFKSWRSTGDVRLAPLTAIFGSNSSGKTSLLQFLLMLKQTADSPDRNQAIHLGDDRSAADLGTFQEMVHRHDLNRPLEWEIDWNVLDPLQVKDPTDDTKLLFSGRQLGFDAAVDWRTNGRVKSGRAAVKQFSYRFAERKFGMRRSSSDDTTYDLFSTPPGFKFVRTPGRVWKLPAPAKCYGFPDQVRGYYQNAGFLSDFELQFEGLFSHLYYLGPLRDYPKRQYLWAGAQPADMGRRGERVIDALLASRESGQKISLGKGRKSLTLEERVAKWLKELGLIEDFAVRPITEGAKLFQVWVRRERQATEVLIPDVGFGVSQILPVITLCYYAPEGSTLILEQPEIHLHPSVQAGLADVFIDAMKTRRIQIILESHSEHLLRRLQRRVAEETLHAEDSALYFCSMAQGESRLVGLDLDMFGAIKNWPDGFFGDDFAEIAATSKAALRRRHHDLS